MPSTPSTVRYFRTTRVSRLTTPITALVVLGGIVVFMAWAGYVLRWSWIGLGAHRVRLWDWLNLLGLPIAVILLPTAFSERAATNRPRRGAVLAWSASLAVFIGLAYIVPLRFTGFAGNTLWDWLHLTLPPLAVASLSFGSEPITSLFVRYRRWMLIAATSLIACILGGYLLNWSWTGFRGNTAWDWAHLLLVPVAIPTVLRPAAHAVLRGRRFRH